MTHKRSRQKFEERKRKEEERERKKQDIRLANGIVLAYSWRDDDYVIGEIVFHKDHIEIIREKLKATFNGGVFECALNHEFGEVLNGFEEGVFQKP